MDGALLDFESLSIPSAGSNAKGIVTGHVVSAGGKPVAPNPDQACATSFGNTDTMTAAVTY